MASYLFRRSGISVGIVADWIGWTPDAVYSVGVGQHHEEIDVMKESWPGCRFAGCEPHPLIYRSEKDKFPGVLSHVALSDYVGTGMLYTKATHKDGSSLRPHEQMEREHYDTIEVPVSTLDSLWGKPIGNHVLLWIDCEGSEAAVLRGGPRFLRGVEAVNVEMTPNPHGFGWDTPKDIHNLLKGYGFLQQWIHTQRAGQYDAIYVRRHLFQPKYCCSVWQVEEYNASA